MEPGQSGGWGASRLTVAVALVVIGVGIRLARPVLAPLLLAGFVAAITFPLVIGLRRHRVPAAAAVGLAMTVVVAGLTALALLVVRSVDGLENRLPEYWALLGALLDRLAGWLARQEVGRARIEELLPLGAFLSSTRIVAQGFAAGVATLALILVVVAFALLEAGGLRQKLARMIRRPADLERMERIVREMNRYLAVKLATSSATGVLAGGWVALLGLDFPILWGLTAFILNFVPNVGSIVAAVPPILLATLQGGIVTALLVALGYLIINFAIGNIIEPRVMGRALGLSPLVVLLAVFFWGWLLGPVGAFLSVPLTMIAKISCAASEDLGWVAVLLGPPEPEPLLTRAARVP